MNSIRCSQCKHCLVANAGEGKIYSCDRPQCVFEPTTKNNLGVDCISRKQAIDAFPDLLPNMGYNKKAITEILQELPSVTPQEQQTFKWCTDCKEYDQEKHCCHRWSKVIRDTVEEMKQEYIEREVLDKIRAEIEQKLGTHGNISLYNRAIYDVLMIIDRYKAESEVDNGND